MTPWGPGPRRSLQLAARITVKGTHWSSSSVLQPAASSFAPHFVRVLRLLGLGAVGLSSVRSSARVSRKRSQDDKECSRVPGVASNGVPLVEVVKVSDEVGLGLVVPQGATAGSLLIEEAPLFHRPHGHSLADSVLAFNQMTEAKRKLLLSLAASPGVPEKEVGFEGDNLRFVRVLRTNSVAVRESAGSGGAVYAVSCRANHSCKPNAALCVQEDGTMHLKALRDLHPGEAVFVSYIGEGDLLRPRPHRQEQLGHWGFTCNCERCGAAEDTRGFRCSCGSGVMKYEASEVGPGHRWGPCNCCKAVLPEETLLGTEELWQEHVFSLRPERTKHLSQIALAMYDGLVDQAAETESIVPALDGHWISAKLARLAAEELIRQERVQDARAAAQLLRRYVRKTLGVAATRISAFASYIEAAAAAVEGKEQEAQELCQAALREAQLLPRNGDQLSEKVGELQRSLVKQKELTMS